MPKPRITPTDWPRIRDAYVNGGKTQQQLADEYGVSPSAMGRAIRDAGAPRYRAKPKLLTVAEVKRRLLARK